MSVLQGMGPFNGVLPEASGIVIAFMRNPKTMPYLRYSQFVPAPDVNFTWTKIDPNLSSRLPNLDTFEWPYGGYRPLDNSFRPRVAMEVARIGRRNFSYTVANEAQRIFTKAGINYQGLCDSARMNHAHLHRAVRVITELQGGTWSSGLNSGSPQSLLNLPSPITFDESSGQQYQANGAENPAFQIIKRTLQQVMKLIKLNTSNAVSLESFQWVMPPDDAYAIARSGEMVEYLKGSPFAREIATDNLNGETYGLPARYAGFEIVVEDTPRVITNERVTDTGDIGDVLVPDEKNYIMPAGTSYFTCRMTSNAQNSGLDGMYGTSNYSTVTIFTWNGEAQVEVFGEPKHRLLEGNIVTEDKVIVPTTVSGFRLTDYRR